MRTALFIDGPNLFATSKVLGIDLDFKRLLAYYGEDLVRAYYYTALIEDAREEYSSIRPLIDWLSYNGYSLVTKAAKEFVNSNGQTKIKGNMDCELTVDALELAHNKAIEQAVFFTGDGDFVPLILAIQRRGVRCTIVSSIQMKPPMCADELRRSADVYIDLVDLAKHLTRPPESRPNTGSSNNAPGRSKYA